MLDVDERLLFCGCAFVRPRQQPAAVGSYWAYDRASGVFTCCEILSGVSVSIPSVHGSVGVPPSAWRALRPACVYVARKPTAMSKLLVAALVVLLVTQAAASSRSLTQLQLQQPFGPGSSSSSSTSTSSTSTSSTSTSTTSRPPSRLAWLQYVQQLLQSLATRPNTPQQVQKPARPAGVLGFLLNPLASRPSLTQQQPGSGPTPTGLSQLPTKPEPTGPAKQPPTIGTLPSKVPSAEQKPAPPALPGKEPLQKPGFEPPTKPSKEPLQKPDPPTLPSKPAKDPKPLPGQAPPALPTNGPIPVNPFAPPDPISPPMPALPSLAPQDPCLGLNVSGLVCDPQAGLPARPQALTPILSIGTTNVSIPTPSSITTARPPSNSSTARPPATTTVARPPANTTTVADPTVPTNNTSVTDNNTCVIPAERLQSFEVAVEATAKVQLQQGEGVFGYFSHTFSECDPSNTTLCTGSSPGQEKGVYQNGYCIDTKRSIRTNRTYNVASFSSYSPIADMKCPDAPANSSTPLNPNITSTTLRRLNWLVNTYYDPSVGVNATCVLNGSVTAGEYQSLNATVAGVYGPPSSNDMQAAIWTITGNDRYAGNVTSNNDVVNCLAANALRSSVAAAYTPPCGGTVAVVLVPCDLEMVRTDNQVMISQVPVNCTC